MIDFEMPPEMAAMLIAELSVALVRVEQMDLPSLPDHTPLPDGVMTTGMAVRFLPVLLILLKQLHPQLWEPGALTDALQRSQMMFVPPTVN